MKRAGLLALLVAALVVAFVIAKGSGSDNNKTTTSSSNQPVVINVVGGKPQGGVQKIQVKKGDPVRFKVNSDVADEIHVHGYDFHKDVEKGGSVSFDFPAKISGIFDIELEAKGEQIASLEVTG
jgi:heme/copper-type cytochrome/quinol oxidase subunit 2